MSKRKTINVAWLVDKANHIFEHSVDGFTAQRSGVASLLEAALFEAGQYKGYGYLPSETLGNGVLREGYDDTRRWYYGGTRPRPVEPEWDCETEAFSLSDCKHWDKPGTECSGPRVGKVVRNGVILCEGHYNETP